MSNNKIEAIYPLTAMQQALLFHSLYESMDQGFLQVQCRLKGRLDYDLLQQAWVKTCQRHSALRTSIHWKDIEKPVQVIHPKINLDWTEYDWHNLSTDELSGRVEKFKEADRAQGFDLSTVPVSRLALIRISEDEYFLIWSCHHILLDGWSAAVILKDVFVFYDAMCKEKKATLETLPSYRSYINWIQKQNLEQAESFWKKTLKGFHKPALLATGIQSDKRTPGAFRELEFSLSVPMTGQLQNFARQHHITLSTLLQGVWAILMSRYLHTPDVIFGATVSGRSIPLPNMELLAGLFMNVLPVRVQIQPDLSFSDWLESIQKQQMAARNFEYVSLDQIMSWTNWPGYLPIFDTLLVVENFPWNNLSGGKISVQDFSGGITTTYPFTIVVKPGPQLEFQFLYQHHQVSEETVKWFARHLELLLNSIATDPVRNLSEWYEMVIPFSYDKNGGKTKRNDKKVEADNIDYQDEAHDYIAPRNALELKLTKIWEEIFGRHPISVSADFFDMGGSSLMAVRLFAQIEEQLGRNLSPATLLQHRTIESLAQALQDEDHQTWSSLVPIRASGSRPPLFCVHAGGAHIFFYNAMARHLSADQPVYAIQPTGMDGTASMPGSVEEMASRYLEEIRKIQPEGPYAFLGTCFSNAVCFEMAKQLEKGNQQLSLLAIIDSAVVDLVLVNPSTAKTKLQRIPVRFRRFINRFKQNPVKAIGTIFKARMTRVRIALEKRFYFLKSRQAINLLNVQKNLVKLHLQYQWEPIEGKITLIRSREYHENPNLDYHVTQWADLAKSGLDVFVVPGHHDTLFEEPEVQPMAKQLDRCLDSVYKELA